MVIRFNSLRVLVVVAGLMFVCACARSPTGNSAPIDGDLAITGVNVISMASPDEIAADSTVVIAGGRVVAIFPSGERELAASVEKIELNGAFVIPGLADMHIHLGGPDELPLYIANGVTLVRNMWGDEETLAMRSAIADGSLLGPRIVTAGTLVDGKPGAWPGSEEVDTPERAREVVLKQKSAGYDFVKVYSLMPVDVFNEIAVVSAEVGIPFAGHVPLEVEVADAIRSGIDSVEHLYGFERATAVNGIDLGMSSMSPEKISIGARMNAGELAAGDVFSDTRLQELAILSRDSNTWNVPTLIVLKNFALTRDQADDNFAREEMKYVPAPMRAFWNPDSDFRRAHFSDTDFEALQAYFDPMLDRVRVLNDAGAGLLAGTDSSNPFVFPGFSLHEELELLVDAGLTPFEALQTATSNVGKFLGEPQLGRIEVGANANLVVLSDNPLDDIRHTRDITGVIRNGEWLAADRLAEMLEGAEAKFAASPAQAPEAPEGGN